MIKKAVLVGILLGLTGVGVQSFANAPVKNAPTDKAKVITPQELKIQDATAPLMVDDFESGDLKKWYIFDKINAQVVPAPTGNVSFGKFILKLSGQTEGWYVGGMGVWFAQDISNHNALSMYVYGNGPSSGTMKIEIADDDNNNFVKEQNEKFELTKDDNWGYELAVNWTGWKKVIIPLNKFVDLNPLVGNNIFDANQKMGSGGALTVQLIFIAPKQVGEVNLSVDQIQFIKID